jgi:hypothetical protein
MTTTANRPRTIPDRRVDLPAGLAEGLAEHLAGPPILTPLCSLPPTVARCATRASTAGASRRDVARGAESTPGRAQASAGMAADLGFHVVVGTGVDPVTFRFSGGRSAN